MNCCNMTLDIKEDPPVRMEITPVKKVVTSNYEDLQNKPRINGVTLIGDMTSKELLIEGDKFFAFSQLTPSAEWRIEHPLDKFPAVTVVDSGGSVVIGDIEYIDNANITITFQSAFAGKAYLN